MKKLVIVHEKNKKFRFKTREVRTPVTLEATDQEIKELKLAFKMSDIQNYTIKDIVKIKEADPFIELEDKEVIIEELDLEDSEEERESILEKLMAEKNNENN